ncbi:type II toxin-antitoxin system RelE/ParE family toxin [Flavobacterium sp. RHBU_24]|uniref:type II toxin-antitoxin system RelE/ParE family toxin n=1 Tax=Flavobacterium sp. RHBU_24 TaxID=3391185 RepID=UPI003984837F
MKIQWTKKASSELIAIIEYIKKDSPQNAVMVFEEVHKLADSLLLFPEKYPILSSAGKPNVRFTVLWNMKLIYVVRKDSITISRVFGTRQHPEKPNP